MSEWQPINDDAKTGVACLLYLPIGCGIMRVGWWQNLDLNFDYYDPDAKIDKNKATWRGTGFETLPTYWMPLPAMPSSLETTQGG